MIFLGAVNVEALASAQQALRFRRAGLADEGHGPSPIGIGTGDYRGSSTAGGADSARSTHRREVLAAGDDVPWRGPYLDKRSGLTPRSPGEPRRAPRARRLVQSGNTEHAVCRAARSRRALRRRGQSRPSRPPRAAFPQSRCRALALFQLRRSAGGRSSSREPFADHAGPNVSVRP